MYKTGSTIDRAFNAILRHEIRKLNTHLPKRRLPLNELLESTDPTLEAVDGTTIILKSAELQELGKIVPEEFHGRLKLPIIVLRRMELGKSVYTVSGDRIEEFTLKKILELTTDDYQEMYWDKNTTYLYKPQISELLRRFHSLIVIGFGIPRELADYGPNRD